MLQLGLEIIRIRVEQPIGAYHAQVPFALEIYN